MMTRLLGIGSALLGLNAGLAAGQVCEPELLYQGPRECAQAGPPALGGDLLYVPIRAWGFCHDAGLWIYDVSDPSAPRERGRLPMGDVYSLAVTGDLAVAATTRSRESFLSTIDISDPESPRPLGEIMLSEAAGSVAVAGSLAYVTGTDMGLMVIDISDPETPAIVSSLKMPGAARHIVVDDHLAYMAHEEELRIIDVADPAAPVELGSVAMAATLNRLAVHEATVYAATARGLRIVDARDPGAPSVVATIAGESPISSVGIEPPLLWFGEALTNREFELVVIDISDPLAPVRHGGLLFPGDPEIIIRGLDLVIRHPVAYVLDVRLITHDAIFQVNTVDTSSCPGCPADCDGSGALDFSDFLCFQNLYAASDRQADCDASGELDVFDFLCFQNEFAAGCP